MPRVIVIGGANVDIKGRASGSFVGATSNPGEVTMSVGGVARNIAENLARLGCESSLLTVLGEDANGRLIREAAQSAGVDLSLTLTGPAPTGIYLVILDRKGELQSALSAMQAIEWLKPAHLEAATERLATAEMLVADCNIDVSCLEWLCTFSARTGVRLLIEPVSVPKAKKLLKFRRAQPVFAITPNEQQLQALTGKSELAAALAGLHGLGFENVIVHRGAGGAVASSRAGRTDLASFSAGHVADVTGAGDAAVAGLIAGVLEGLTLLDAGRLGQAAASVKLASRESVAADLNRDRLRLIAGM
jgi:pseudouridine kinase